MRAPVTHMQQQLWHTCLPTGMLAAHGHVRLITPLPVLPALLQLMALLDWKYPTKDGTDYFDGDGQSLKTHWTPATYAWTGPYAGK
jgi:hypothetical protein